MKNDNVKSLIVLTSCALVIMVLLAGINILTADRIEENNYKKMMESLEGLIPEIETEDYEQIADLSSYPKSISAVFVDKEGRGIAVIFTAKSQYSSSPMKYAVGFDADGKIISINQITYMESKSFGNYYKSFAGLEEAEAEGVEVFGGVTYSSNAFKSGLKNAFEAFEIANNQ